MKLDKHRLQFLREHGRELVMCSTAMLRGLTEQPYAECIVASCLRIAELAGIVPVVTSSPSIAENHDVETLDMPAEPGS